MDATLNFVIWGLDEVRNACRLQAFHGFEPVEMFAEGVPIVDIFPSDSHFEMNPDFPFDLLLTDTLYNLHDLIIISDKERAFLKAKKLINVEYLPVDIRNHKGRPVEEKYFIVHPINPVDCLDLTASNVVWSEIDTSAIEEVNRISIDESKVSSTLDVFRIKHLGRVIIIRRALAEDLDTAEFSGNEWIEIDQFSD